MEATHPVTPGIRTSLLILCGLVPLGILALCIVLIVPMLTCAVSEGDFTALRYRDRVFLSSYAGKQQRITLPSQAAGIPISGMYAFTDESGMVEEIVIPDDLDGTAFPFDLSFPALQRYDVSDAHPTLTVIDGVLYSRDGSTLIACPQGRTTPVTVPADVQVIAEKAFPASDSSTLRLIVTQGSSAHAWALENGMHIEQVLPAGPVE